MILRDNRQVESPSGHVLRFLFVTLQHVETEFYARVAARLTVDGHEVAHVTFSRRAARRINDAGAAAYCLPDLMARQGRIDIGQEAARIAADYDVPDLRELYRTDFVTDQLPGAKAIERTVRHVLALERIFEEWRPDILVPEVGSETIRVASHMIALRRKIPTLLLFYTIFPNPLRLCVDDMDHPIARANDLRPLTDRERDQVTHFIREFVSRDRPIRHYRRSWPTARKARMLMRHILVKAVWDRDNDYLRPASWAYGHIRELLRTRLAARLYQPPPDRPYLYFPLHVADDYKLKRLVPECADQPAIIARLAQALPDGHELVLKEHPMSIGRNPLAMLGSLSRMPGVRIVPPQTSSHSLIRDAQGVVVISSTVGLEALLHNKPVLTLGKPFYAGAGVTLDLVGPSALHTAIPDLLKFCPDNKRIEQFLYTAMMECVPGVPGLVDHSEDNALALARSIARAGVEAVASRQTANTPRSSSDPHPVAG